MQVIAWQRITSKNQFCLSESGTVILDSMAFLSNIEANKYYLQAILNSNLIYFWIKQNVPEYGNTGFRLSNQFVEVMPIPVVSVNQHEEFIEIIKQIIENKKNGLDTAPLENDVNGLVYKLYDLTEDEISFINKN